MRYTESKTYGIRLCPDDRVLEAKLRQQLGVKTFSALVSVLLTEAARARSLLPPVQPVKIGQGAA